MEDLGLFYGNFVYLKDILYILWPFGHILWLLCTFYSFGMLHQEKSGNPALGISFDDVSGAARNCDDVIGIFCSGCELFRRKDVDEFSNGIESLELPILN
jgi:hypothetical protein